MAIMECPECRKSLSTQAATCPNCGFRLARHFRAKAKNDKKVAKIRALQELVQKNLKPGTSPKQLFTVNTGGFTMFGFVPIFKDADYTLGLSIYAICALYIPLVSLGVYLVRRSSKKSYHFYGRVPFRSFIKELGILETFKFIGGIFISRGLGAIFSITVVVGGILLIVYAFHGCS